MKNGNWHGGRLRPSDEAASRVVELLSGSTAQDDEEAHDEVIRELDTAYRIDVDPVIEELIGAQSELQRRYNYSLDQFARLDKDWRDAETECERLRNALRGLETHIITRHRLSDYEAHLHSLWMIREALGKKQDTYLATAAKKEATA